MRGWLMRGSRGDYVQAIQEFLYQAGIYKGRIDGWFGPKMESAVKDWQREAGVKIDGAWGNKTTEGTAQLLARFNDDEALAAGKPAVVAPMGRTFGGQ